LIIAIVGTVTLVRMPVDLFPPINIPVVVVATFYSGMPPQQIEASITNPFERFFTLASGVDHIESRSLPGVSLVKVYFQPGSNADSDVSTVANLAMAQLRRLPQGTLPPVVLKFDASSLPVCLITLKGEGLNETRLKDLAQERLLQQLDHKNLNLDVAWFRDLNPTSENIALVCWRELRAALPAELSLRVRLWETPRNYVDYEGG